MIRLPGYLILVSLLGVITTAQTRAEDAKTDAPMTGSHALKLGLDGLLNDSDPSEAGQDRAARLYATARRVETENSLAKKDLEQVWALDDWRDALSGCRRGSCDLAYIMNGGGTMYTHGAARDCAQVEDFLAGLAKDLPLAEGKGSAKANAKIDSAIAYLKTLKVDLGDADADKEANANLAAERDRVIGKWENLKYMIDEIPSEQAVKIAAFAEDSLGWLKDN